MTDNTITITLEDVLGPDGLEGAWNAMVRGLVERAESKFLYSDGTKSFHKVSVEAINEAVQNKIAQRIEEMMAAPIQPTDRYGTPMGKPTTFTEMIGAAVEAACVDRVDVYGRPDKNGSITLMEHAIKRVAQAELSKAVTAEARKVNTEAKAAISRQIADAVAKTLKV